MLIVIKRGKKKESQTFQGAQYQSAKKIKIKNTHT